jgi:SLA1 homology domain 1, SHD1
MPATEPGPANDDSDNLDNLFNDDSSSDGAAATGQAESDVAATPAPADVEETAATDTETPAELSDDLAAEDAPAAPPAEPAEAEEAIDFSDTTPDSADVAEPADAAEPADEVAGEEPAMEDAATEPTEPTESAEDAEPAEPMSSDTKHRDAEAPAADLAANQPAADDGMRLWTDNTGKYHVRARLVLVRDGKVRLQKETGRFTTVPFERLSVADLAFVRRQAPTVASADARPLASNQTASNPTTVGR